MQEKTDREQQNKENNKEMKQQCVLQVNTAFTRVLDMEMPAECSDHVLTVRTGGIFFLSDTRGEHSVLKKKNKKAMADRQREGESLSLRCPQIPHPDKLDLHSQTQTQLYYSFEQKNPHSPTIQSLSCSFISQKESLESMIQTARSAGFQYAVQVSGNSIQRESEQE